MEVKRILKAVPTLNTVFYGYYGIKTFLNIINSLVKTFVGRHFKRRNRSSTSVCDCTLGPLKTLPFSRIFKPLSQQPLDMYI